LGTLPGENSHYVLTLAHEKTFLQKTILKIYEIDRCPAKKAQVMPSDHTFKQNCNHLNAFIIFTRQKYHLYQKQRFSCVK